MFRGRAALRFFGVDSFVNDAGTRPRKWILTRISRADKGYSPVVSPFLCLIRYSALVANENLAGRPLPIRALRKGLTRAFQSTQKHALRMHRVLDRQRGKQISAGFCALAIMTKAPRAGTVKTRLQPPLTPSEAAELNTCFLRDIAAVISAAGERSQGVGVFTPVRSEKEYEGILPSHFDLIPQRGNGFGERLTNAADDLLHVGFESCCLINSDSPTATVEAFGEAVAQLQDADDRIVLGPSDDGGYYLIGMRKLNRHLFEEIDWSTERVFAQTDERAREVGLKVHLLPKFYDVDDGATLRRLCEELLRGNSRGDIAPVTTKFLAELIAREGWERICPQ